jgi:putative nucleotidyltransferase with HDIG domain
MRSTAAHEIGEALLATPLPRRWRHSLGVGRQAVTLRPVLGDDAELLECSAILHDIGYSPELVDTGCHAIDGARYLRHAVQADERLVRLVAHHSCAAMEAEERNLVRQMGEFEPDTQLLTDALSHCDMTTTPDGGVTTVDARLAEIMVRYGPDSIVGRFIVRAAPELRAASARTLALVHRAQSTTG